MNTANATMRDLIADIRFCRREIADNTPGWDRRKYHDNLVSELRLIWNMRHNFKMDRYGLPVTASGFWKS